jgi:predicted methyltransferase
LAFPWTKIRRLPSAPSRRRLSSGPRFATGRRSKARSQIRDESEKEKLIQIQTIHGSQDDPKLPELSLDAVLVVDAFHEFTNVDAMVAGIFRGLKPGGRLGVIDHTARLGLKPADYRERHILPQEILIGQAVRGGLRLVSFDSDFAGPPGESAYYFAIFEKAR